MFESDYLARTFPGSQGPLSHHFRFLPSTRHAHGVFEVREMDLSVTNDNIFLL